MDFSAASSPLHNADFDWELFDVDAYIADNYHRMRDDDQQIVTRVRDFFAASKIGPAARGVDIGTGGNLYPMLGMLPFCGQIELYDLPTANVAWLRDQVTRGFDGFWDPYWKIYTEHPEYAGYAERHDVRAEFTRKVSVHQKSVFALPTARWDIGTMFFVACSISRDRREFQDAVHAFVRSLRPGAPFAAAFMAGSTGYQVAGWMCPAVTIELADVDRALASIAYDVTVCEIDTERPMRADVRMLLATGFAAGR